MSTGEIHRIALFGDLRYPAAKMKRPSSTAFPNVLPTAFKSLLLAASLWLPMEARAETPPNATVDDLARVVLSYFPAGAGRVTAISGDTVQIDLPNMSGPAAGVVLSVYREREPFHHPVTGVELGRFEDAIGEIEVAEVTAESVAGRILSGDVKIGDGVRIPLKIPLSLSPATDGGPIPAALAAVLVETGRFQIDPAKAGYLLHVTPLPETTHLALRMQNARTGRTLFEMTAAMHASEADPVLERWRHLPAQPPSVEK